MFDFFGYSLFAWHLRIDVASPCFMGQANMPVREMTAVAAFIV
jgi:hypothetical protein